MSGFLFLGVIATKPASNDRQWDVQFEKTPDVQWRGSTAELNWVRDWGYDGLWSIASDTWIPKYYVDPQTVEAAWVAFEPHRFGDFAAHTFLLFVFEDGTSLALSIDARRPDPETTKSRRGLLQGRAIRGLLNGYELIYSWSTGRDHLLRRARFAERPFDLHRINRSQDDLVDVLTELLDTTAQLADKPVFYNTFVRNCTSELTKVFDLSWHYSDILTGYADTRYFNIGFAGEGASFDEAEEIANVTADVESMPAHSAAAFDTALIEYLMAQPADPADPGDPDNQFAMQGAAQ